MAAILSAEHLSKSYTLKKLLTDVTIYIGEHDRIGVVGVNGTGKSTILKLLAGEESRARKPEDQRFRRQLCGLSARDGSRISEPKCNEITKALRLALFLSLV